MFYFDNFGPTDWS